MSRDLEAGADAALQAEHVDEIVFLEFDFLSGTSRVCSREHSVEWNGFTWLGAGRVGTVEAVGEGGELEARGIAMTLSGLTGGLLATALTPAEYKGRAVRMWCGQMEETRYLSLPGTAGNYASTPDSAAVSITGDIDIRVKVAMDDWTPAAIAGLSDKRGAAGDRSWYWRLVTTGFMDFRWSVDGTAETVIGTTAAVGASDGQVLWMRVTLDVNNGAGGNDVKFYTSSDGVIWTQLGATVTTAGVTSIFDSSAAWGIGDINAIAGKVYSAELRNGIDGPVVARFDASLMSPRQTSAQMPTGEVWTINQSGTPNAHIERDAAAIAADPIGPFLFKMDQLTYQLGQTATIRLTAESRLADWQRPRVRRYNNADHQVLYPNDKFFEHVEKQVEVVHIW